MFVWRPFVWARLSVCNILCLHELRSIREKAPLMPAEVRSGHRGVHPTPAVVGREAGGGLPALLGNSLGLIGAWLVSHVSTYCRRRRIPLPGLWELLWAWAFPLHQHNHRGGSSPSRPYMTVWVSGVVYGVFQLGSVHWGQVFYTELRLCVFKSLEIFDLFKSLLVQLVLGISFPCSICLLLFSFNLF